jgi:predicted N-acetyltransferase YhbS
VATVYKTSASDVLPEHLSGFFVGWPHPPSAATHLELLRRSDEVILAVEDETAQVVGFVTAITDGVLSAFIPLLEVLPAHQGRGIGGELMRRMLDRLRRFYMVDLSCDAPLQPFYERLGMRPAQGMALRRADRLTDDEAAVP